MFIHVKAKNQYVLLIRQIIIKNDNMRNPDEDFRVGETDIESWMLPIEPIKQNKVMKTKEEILAKFENIALTHEEIIQAMEEYANQSKEVEYKLRQQNARLSGELIRAKNELASMLIQSNKHLEALRKPDVMQSFCDIGYYPDQSSGAEGRCVNCGRLENEH